MLLDEGPDGLQKWAEAKHSAHAEAKRRSKMAAAASAAKEAGHPGVAESFVRRASLEDGLGGAAVAPQDDKASAPPGSGNPDAAVFSTSDPR